MSDSLKKTFPVTGMTCASCAASIQKKLATQKGVRSAAVNYANATALVEYQPVTASLTAIRKAIQGIGYDIITGDDTTAEDIESLNDRRYRNLYYRTIFALVLSAPLVAVSMFFMHMPYANFIMWGLATPVIIVSGWPFFTGAVKQARHGSANMDTLIALSSGIAYLFSAFNTLFPQYLNHNTHDAPVYFEASAVVIAFILLGKLLEERARTQTSGAIKKLMGLRPLTVTLFKEGFEDIVNIDEVVEGDIVIVKPGEKIAVDGTVVDGESHVNESMLTGEPAAVAKTLGSKVYAGTINQKGSFRFKVDKTGSETLLSNIIRKVQEAQGSKAPVEKLADKIAAVFVPIVLFISVGTFIAWALSNEPDSIAIGIKCTVAVLAIACPCALGLATPTAIIAGIGRFAENGILVRDAESLETIQKIDTIVFDKTGTITEGLPQVVDIAWKNEEDTALLSSVLLAMELKSEHPMAGAITSFFNSLQITPVEVKSFSNIPGSGVTALYGRNIYFAGNLKLLRSMSISVPVELEAKSDKWLENSNTIIWLANQNTALAAIAISDKIKLSSPAAVAQLRSMGIKSYLLTGDNPKTAYTVAHQTGIADFKAEASPDDKFNFIKSLQDAGHIVAMAGDGINDSPALAQANVSIAMGAGTDIAMDVAKLTLISSDLLMIPRAIILSHRTVKTIRQNLFWAFVYNVVAIPIAAGALYPVNGFLLNPMIAGAAMALSSVSVVTNSLRLKWGKIDVGM